MAELEVDRIMHDKILLLANIHNIMHTSESITLSVLQYIKVPDQGPRLATSSRIDSLVYAYNVATSL